MTFNMTVLGFTANCGCHAQLEIGWGVATSSSKSTCYFDLDTAALDVVRTGVSNHRSARLQVT